MGERLFVGDEYEPQDHITSWGDVAAAIAVAIAVAIVAFAVLYVI